MQPSHCTIAFACGLFLFHTTLAQNNTVSSPQLVTWWHDEGVFDSSGPISDASVRQSHLYSVQVTPANNLGLFYDSFVYESIPRNGNGQVTAPNDLNSVDDTMQDGVTIEPLLNTTMAWTQFLYDEDVVLKIQRIDKDADSASSSGVTIRPTTYDYTISSDDSAIYVTVPHLTTGTRFSLEFEDDLISYHTLAMSPACSGSQAPVGNCQYVQDVSDNAGNFYIKYNSSMPSVGVEPRNALLIFASPFPPEELVANDSADKTLTVQPGFVSNLDKTDAETVFFPPGVYYFSSTAHAILAQSVTWVYLSPGAYVKGALEFSGTNASALTVSGFGVLSGEQYVFMANSDMGYHTAAADDNTLRMFRAVANGMPHMTFTLNGITMANPPFNSMDFYSDVCGSSVNAWDYKQVGSWFDQTDGLENYPGSVVRDVFYHSSDDAIKLYHDNVTIENIVIWKKANGGAIQLGWHPRNVSNIVVSDVTQIHSRYFSNDAAGTTGDALIMSTVFPDDATSMNTANTDCYLSDVRITNLRAEGVSPSLLRLSPLMNYDTFTVENAWIEELSPIETGLQTSWARKWTDSENYNQPVKFGESSPDGIGVKIKNFSVGTEKVSFDASNWDAAALGALDIDEFFWGHWSVE